MTLRLGMFVPQGWRLDLVDIPAADQWPTMLDLARHADEGDVFESIWVQTRVRSTFPSAGRWEPPRVPFIQGAQQTRA